MRVIMVMFDSLNRHFLPPYGNTWVHAPNFGRLTKKTVIFDNCYAGSLPCMPARRELHTGRYNFLHRSWGPIEPFDDSMPEILKKKGVYTHLTSDHYHYWEDGGCTYHNRYSTWELSRGHEGDLWKGEVKDPEIPEHVATMREGTSHWRQDWINRKYMQKEEDQPQAKTFRKGLEFIKKNHEEDNWFLHIETFDPHEPYFTQKKYKDLYKHDYDGPHFDWPNYSVVMETPEQVDHCRKEYAASVSMCDHYLGKVLDMMDEYDMWKDTMLIVNTDHGFLLGEKGWWAKMVQPIYNEISHIPFFIWDPRCQKKNERRAALVQTIDIAPTILDFFNIKPTKDMQGKILADTVATDKEVRDCALFGIHGGHINVTDGHYLYMRGPINADNKPLYNYTVMPTHMTSLFSVNELRTAKLAEPFKFTKICKTMKIEVLPPSFCFPYLYGSFLFDLKEDPYQENPLNNPEIEKKMLIHLRNLMKVSDAPKEQYQRLGIPIEGSIEDEHLFIGEVRDGLKDKIGDTEIIWTKKGKSMYSLILSIIALELQKPLFKALESKIKKENHNRIDEQFLMQFLNNLVPKAYKNALKYVTAIIETKAI